ncbi:4-hydroxy-3-methylbut-2-en-1-yl diphosphate synthase-like protein [Leptospira santarosai str. HAI134]|nr:4-hydroxy-3-methylbut-2-en-1-yl diphosphate synthase-like protein [Leptospira santarosai str. HAI134]
MNFRYNHTPFGYKRRQTREVKVGDVKIGGNNPIVIQSMINSDTTDTEGSVKQILE